jgi:hypothetical protein
LIGTRKTEERSRNEEAEVMPVCARSNSHSKETSGTLRLLSMQRRHSGTRMQQGKFDYRALYSE